MRSTCSHDPAHMVARQALFASLSEEECRALVRRSHCRALSRNEILFREGDPCRGLYLVIEGDVRLYRANPDGLEQVFGVFGPGESLDEVSLFDDGPHLASARAVESGRVLFLPFAEVQALYRTHPEVAHAVVRELSQRVRRLTSLVDRVALKDVPTRVAAAVLGYAEEAGALGSGGAFRLPRTQEELAAELATTRESVARALHDLRERGVIRQRRAHVEVLDDRRLRTLARGAGRPEPRAMA
ncbi:MAG TPA: Crp/Fnr family transcriptional regulator [Longimicrobiaceae bacterium]|nr:Crp/Fnr family transcriptional regulator [Longimicrobiaceae bacterium]